MREPTDSESRQGETQEDIPMRRALKYLFGFLGLVVVAVIAALMLIPREQIVALAADQVRNTTGRELTLAGDLSPSFWPVLGVRTGPITLSNADWAEAGNMVSASAAEIGVELVPLFSGEIKVTALRLVDPVIALEIDTDGRANWIFDDEAAVTSGGSGETAGELPKISLPEAVITNGKISFHDAKSGQRIELAALDLTAGLEGFDAPLSLKGSGLWNGERARFEAFIDTPAAAMEGSETSVRVSLASDPASFSFDGDLLIDEDAPLPLVNGKITADLPILAAAVAWATGARAPAGLADLGAVKVDGSVAASEAALRLVAKGSIGYKGRAVGFDLKADGANGWLDRQAFTVTASGQSDGLFQFSFGGPVSAGGTLAAEGPLKVTVSDLRGLAKWAGGAALDAPAGTLDSASLDARLALKGGDRIDLSGLSLRLDRTTMTGDASVNMGGARPMISARLNSGPLDLSPFMGDGAGGSGGGAAVQGWSTDPLDLSALRAVDAEVAIRAEAVDLGDIEIGRSDIDARLNNGRLDMKIARVDAYGGGMSGTIVLVAGEEAQLSTDLTVSAVQLRPLLNALAGFDSLEGLGAFRIKVNGRGRSMDALMNSLDGRGGLDLTDGAILGLNLASMVRNLTGEGGSDQKTDFTAVTGTFDITNGVLNNTDFSFLGPLLRVIGAGSVDIGGQAQNFRLEPTAVASLTGQGGALEDAGLGIFPILITGTWANPSIRPDLTAALEGLLSNPEGTLEAVTGLIDGADPGKAAESLLGAVTGGGGGDDSPAGALGQVLGGAAQDEPEAGGGAKTGGATSGLGGLLGALGGGTGRDDGGDGAVAQPTFDGTPPVPTIAEPEIDATDLAPVYAPVPIPANRQGLAALQRIVPPATQEQPAIEPAVEPAVEPDESIAVPSMQYTPEPEPTQPPATFRPAPEPEAVPAPAPEAVPQAEPEPVQTESKPKVKRREKAKDEEEQPGRGRDKEGGLTPRQLLKSLEK
jgi:AsmA protein